MNVSPLRVLLVDDNESVRRSIREILDPQTDIQVVCEAADGEDAFQKAREHLPDVVLSTLLCQKSVA